MQAEYRTSAGLHGPHRPRLHAPARAAAVWDGSLCLAGPRRRCVPSTALQDGRIVMRTADPALSAAAGRTASFEFDEIRNEDHRAWNVIVTGELEALDGLALDSTGVEVNRLGTERRRALDRALRIADVSGREVPEPHVPRRSSGLTPSVEVEVEKPDIDPDADGIDLWGRSARARQVTRALMEPAYRYWFRFSFEHLSRIPAQGGALLVANHAGVIPIDAALVMHGIERTGRPVCALHHHGLAAVPVLGTLLARAGGVVAHPDNALRLLRDDRQLLLVFLKVPGASKPYVDRYRLARFGRGGFVDTAMRAGVPIVPIAIVGTEETMPIMVRLPGGWPVTLNSLMFGPFAAGVHFPATITARVLEPVELDEPPGLERYPPTVWPPSPTWSAIESRPPSTTYGRDPEAGVNERQERADHRRRRATRPKARRTHGDRADLQIVIGGGFGQRSHRRRRGDTPAPRLHRARRPVGEPRWTRSSTPIGGGPTPMSAGTAVVST